MASDFVGLSPRSSYLENANDYPERDEVFVGLDEGHAASADAPNDHDDRKEYRRLRLRQDEITRYLEDHVRNEENNKRNAILVGVHLKIVGHAGHFGIAYVGSLRGLLVASIMVRICMQLTSR